MNFHILTLFPDMVMQAEYQHHRKSSEKGPLLIETVNIRDYTENKHGKVDDYPYGGRAAPMQAQPVYDAWKAGDRVAGHNERRKESGRFM